MIPTDPERRTEVIRYMLEFCENKLDSLSEWEANFITSIRDQFDSKGTLSDRQCDKLEQIYDKL